MAVRVLGQIDAGRVAGTGLLGLHESGPKLAERRSRSCAP